MANDVQNDMAATPAVNQASSPNVPVPSQPTDVGPVQDNDAIARSMTAENYSKPVNPAAAEVTPEGNLKTPVVESAKTISPNVIQNIESAARPPITLAPPSNAAPFRRDAQGNRIEAPQRMAGRIEPLSEVGKVQQPAQQPGEPSSIAQNVPRGTTAGQPPEGMQAHVLSLGQQRDQHPYGSEEWKKAHEDYVSASTDLYRAPLKQIAKAQSVTNPKGVAEAYQKAADYFTERSKKSADKIIAKHAQELANEFTANRQHFETMAANAGNEAMKKAMGTIGASFAASNKIEQDYVDAINGINANAATWQTQYGITPDQIEAQRKMYSSGLNALKAATLTKDMDKFEAAQMKTEEERLSSDLSGKHVSDHAQATSAAMGKVQERLLNTDPNAKEYTKAISAGLVGTLNAYQQAIGMRFNDSVTRQDDAEKQHTAEMKIAHDLEDANKWAKPTLEQVLKNGMPPSEIPLYYRRMRDRLEKEGTKGEQREQSIVNSLAQKLEGAKLVLIQNTNTALKDKLQNNVDLLETQHSEAQAWLLTMQAIKEESLNTGRTALTGAIHAANVGEIEMPHERLSKDDMKKLSGHVIAKISGANSFEKISTAAKKVLDVLGDFNAENQTPDEAREMVNQAMFESETDLDKMRGLVNVITGMSPEEAMAKTGWNADELDNVNRVAQLLNRATVKMGH